MQGKIIQLITCSENCEHQQECHYHINGDSCFNKKPHTLLFVETKSGDQALQCLNYKEHKL